MYDPVNFSVGNAYGGLYAYELENKYYWGVDGYGADNAQEIPKSLYDELLKFKNSLK